MKSKFILASALLFSLAVNAQQNVSTNGKKYVLVTDGTGAWCPYCSDGISRLDDIVTAEPAVIAVGVHNSTPSVSRFDNMEIPDGAAWNSNWCYNNSGLGYPYGTVDCHYFKLGQTDLDSNSVGMNRGYWASAVSQAKAWAPQYDVQMSHSYNSSNRTISISVTAKALAALTGDYNINVWLIEDDVTGTGSGWSQANAYNGTAGHKYYNAGSPIPNFKHQHVLRAMIGGTWGTSAASNPAANSSVTKTFTYVIPATYTPTAGNPGTSTPDLNKMHLIAFVQKATTGSKVNNKDINIINSVEAKFFPWNTNVQNVSNLADLTVYPNPASDMITVNAHLNTPAETKIVITNTVGQTVFSETYPAGGSYFGANISLANLNNGIHFVTITSNGVSTTEKIVVSK